jgi:hypothetical protein
MPKPTSKSRQELRSRFVRNAIPTEADFADLIGASLNQADDGVLKLPDQPLGLVRQKPDQPVLRFFADPAAEGSAWQLQLGAGDRPGFGLAGADGKLALFVDGATGNVGIGIGAKSPGAALHIAGNLKVEAGSITLDRDQKVFFTDNGQIGSRDQYHQLLFRSTENITELREWGDLWFSAGANIENTNQPKMIVKANGLVGIGTAMPAANLQVTGNVSITSAEGKNYPCKNNFMAAGSLTIGGIDRNYGGGTNWNSNTAGLLLETLDNTEIAIHDSGLRLASFMYYEGANNRFTIGRDMGWGAISAVNIQGSLQANGQTNILTGTNPIRFSSAWTGFPDDKTNGAEISNDTSGHKTLMIIGNKSNGGGRRVSVWDILEVNGTCMANGSFQVNGNGNTFKIDTLADRAIFTLAKAAHGTGRQISWDGDNNWDQWSDETLKTNINIETGILPRLLQIDVKSFQWKDDLESKKKQLGFIAQDVRLAFPDLVKEKPFGDQSLMSLNYTNFGILAVGAIKELNAIMAAEIQELRVELDRLKQQVGD